MRFIRETDIYIYKHPFFQTLGQTKDIPSNDIKLEQTTENLDNKTTETVVTKEDQIATSVDVKKRKSTGLFSCFRNKKAKASTEQRGQPTITPPPSVDVTNQTIVVQTTNSLQEKPTVDYAILPDGKRIYIDVFRERADLDMSYKPNDFDTRFVVPIVRIYQ